MSIVAAYTAPMGKPRTIAIANTAGNSSVTKSAGAGKAWLILGMRLKLIADANAADRTIYATLEDATPTVYATLTSHTGVITAGQTKYLSFVPDAGATGGAAFGNMAIVSLGSLWLFGTDAIRFQVNNGLAGDVLSGTMKVLEVG